MSTAGVVLTALASAVAVATSSVLQHRSARSVAGGSARVLLRLVTRPAWLAGLAAGAVGLALHAVALAHGQLALVQPLLVSGVLFALPVSVVLEGRRPSAVEWGWAVVLVAGITDFLVAARPSPGRISVDADLLAWAVAAAGAGVAVVAAVAFRWGRRQSAVLLGAAAGLGFGVAAALLKQTLTVGRAGVLAVIGDWPLYALLAAGAVSIALTQLAYRAGPLGSSMPALTIADPVASVALGVFAFHERLGAGPVAIAGEALGVVLMLAAIAQLARRNARSALPAPS